MAKARKTTKKKNPRIQGQTYFAKGKKFTSVSNKTMERLKKQGVHEIVWKNGDFVAF